MTGWRAAVVAGLLSCRLLAAQTTWEEARKLCFLSTEQAGATRYGYTCYSAQDRSNKAPGDFGWYQLATRGDTPRWADANGNGKVDPGETTQVPFAIWYRGSIDDTTLHLEEVNGGPPYSAAARVADLKRFLPQLSPVAVGRGGVSAPGYCLATSDHLEVKAAVSAYLRLGDGSPAPIYFDRLPELVPAFTEREKLRGECAAARDRCAQMATALAGAALAAWDGWLGQRVGAGPCAKGLYPRDLSAYLPTRAEVRGDFLWEGQFGGNELRLKQVIGPTLYVDMTLTSTSTGSGPADRPLQQAHEDFVRRFNSDKMTAVGLTGADEAGQVARGNAGTFSFRKVNVLGHISYAGPDANSPAPRLARAIVERILLKLVGGPHVGPPLVVAGPGTR